MPDIPKRRYAFPEVDYAVDLYLDGKKVVNRHRGSTGNYYFRLPESCKLEFSVAEHDPQIPIDSEIIDGKLVKIVRRPKFVKTEDPDATAKALRARLEAEMASRKAARSAELKQRMADMRQEKKPDTE
jgi:hypothetical protein